MPKTLPDSGIGGNHSHANRVPSKDYRKSRSPLEINDASAITASINVSLSLEIRT